MSGWSRAVEEQLRKAVESGAFDDLPGKGKPLSLDENPFVDPSWRLAWHLLKSNGFALPWMQVRQEIETQIGQARQDLQRAWHWREGQIAAGGVGGWVDSVWEQAVARFREQVADLNKRIVDYNLQVPAPRFQRSLIDVDAEIAGLKAG